MSAGSGLLLDGLGDLEQAAQHWRTHQGYLASLVNEALYLESDKVEIAISDDGATISHHRKGSATKELKLKSSSAQKLIQYMQGLTTSCLARGRRARSASLLKKKDSPTYVAVRVGEYVVSFELQQAKAEAATTVMTDFRRLTFEEAARRSGYSDELMPRVRDICAKPSGVLFLGSPSEETLLKSVSNFFSISGWGLALSAKAIESDLETLKTLASRYHILVVGCVSDVCQLLQRVEPAYKTLQAETLGVIYRVELPALCRKCKKPHTLSPEELKLFPAPLVPASGTTVWEKHGCDDCSNLGYRGTAGTASVVAASSLEEFLEGSSKTDFLGVIRHGRARFLVESAVFALLDGDVSLEHVESIISSVPGEFFPYLRKLSGSSEALIDSGKLENETPPSADAKGFLDIEMDDSDDLSEVSGSGLVLVVEDDPDQRQIIQMVLGSAGYEIRLARDGVEALELLKEITPDLIISDLMMPRMDGSEFLQQVKSSPETASIPVMILTVVSDSEREAALLELGASEYCEKKTHRKVLLRRIQKLIEGGTE